ncbi:MAG TPA: tetratricopeptide repeat protein [Pyrinomonadaceae bacterium]|jgi:tetratricopeptide (TPR) repeat protein|nr:tetratricopeptide repeat protein [Pyrinomonadaceae bacterium]
MTKDNIMFAIIGVLLGVIVGYVFATNIKERDSATRPLASRTAGQMAQDSELPEDHPPISSNAAKDQGVESGEDAGVLQQAQAEPNNFEVQMQAAAILYQNRRFDEAIQLLTHANQLRPDSYQAIVALGNTNFDAGRYDVAEKWYTAALVKNPKDVNVRTDLGLSFMFREPPNMDRAIKEFRQSLETDPKHEQTLQNLVVALTKKGSLNEAEATLKRLSELNPGNDSLTKLRSDLEAARVSSKETSGRKK